MARADAKPQRPRRRSLSGFYRKGLAEAERLELQEAADVQGLDDEIALLRLKLREALEKRPQDLPLMLKGVELLVKAVSARYRLSKEAQSDLADSLANVIRGVGGQLFPERFEGE